MRIWNFFFRNSFFYLGKKSRVYKPSKINGSRLISIGDFVIIMEYSWLLTLCENNEIMYPKLEIGNGSYIGRYSHIVALNSIKIESNVLIADRVYITDNTHSYNDPHEPIIFQEILPLNPVIIREGAWIGDNVSIIGASIGKNSVVGANSVVTKDIPDYSVAAGIPARIIKYFDVNSGEWIKTN